MRSGRLVGFLFIWAGLALVSADTLRQKLQQRDAAPVASAP